MGEAKSMVEVELDKLFPQRIVAADNKGSISMVDVVYSWIPTKCGSCGHLGHKESRCLQRLSKPQANKVCDSEMPSKTKDAAIVSIPLIEATTTLANEPSIGLEASVESLIEDVSTAHIVEVPLQALESPPDVELLTTIPKPYEVVDAIGSTNLVLVSASTNAHIPQITTMETISPTLDIPYLETTASGNKTFQLAIEPNVCGTMIRDDGAITTPESSDVDVDLMTPSSQRILRGMHVLPNLKYNEDEWILIGSDRRGKRSHGGRRGRNG